LGCQAGPGQSSVMLDKHGERRYIRFDEYEYYELGKCRRCSLEVDVLNLDVEIEAAYMICDSCVDEIEVADKVKDIQDFWAFRAELKNRYSR